MKIIHITPSYKPAYIYGGTILSVAKLCETLASSGEDVLVFTTKANGITELDVRGTTKMEGVDIRFFNRMTKDHTHFSPSLLWAVFRSIQKAEPNVILHIHSWWNLVAITSCIIARMRKVPVVLSPRGMLTQYTLRNRNARLKEFFHDFIGKHLVNYCTVHATSELEKEDISKIAKPKGIYVIPNFLYQPTNIAFQHKIPSNKEISEGYFKLLYLSRIEEKKGLELLFYALAKCHFPWRLTIAGTGEKLYLKTLMELAEIIEISHFITWVGQVDENEKYAVMANHQLLTLLSHNENFANVVLESLSVGTPVAVSDKVGLADFVRKSKLGWVTSLNPRHIINALNDAYENQHRRSVISEKAPSMVRIHFEDQSILKQYLELYKISIG